MKLEELKTISELSQFIDGTQKVIFTLKQYKGSTTVQSSTKQYKAVQRTH